MKKITFIFAMLATTMTFAQDILVERPFDNPDGNGLISVDGNDGTGVYSADYFEITDETALGEVSTIGFGTEGIDLTPFVTGFNVYIYQHDGSGPIGDPTISGSGVVEIEATEDYTLDYDAATGYNNFTVNITDANGEQAVLVPGQYWISMFPSVSTPPAGDGRWNWAGSATSVAFKSVLIDPANLFGEGATSWTLVEDLIAPSVFPSFAWTLTNEPILSVGDNIKDLVSVYPNPVKDVLNVNVPSNIEVNSVAIYDVLGKRSNVSLVNGQVSVSDLANGVYILSIETSAGTLTQKIVKN